MWCACLVAQAIEVTLSPIMCEFAGDWNYANTGIYDESAFILRARLARRFPGAQLPLLQRCRMPRSLADEKFVRWCRCEQEKSA
jgi:hypothetical protein